MYANSCHKSMYKYIAAIPYTGYTSCIHSVSNISFWDVHLQYLHAQNGSVRVILLTPHHAFCHEEAGIKVVAYAF